MAEQRCTCASCGTSNEEDARFCEACGGSLARTCATCGVEATATARFCRGCGAPLEGHAPAQDVPFAAPSRKTVTVMFADLAGSTSFEEKVDAETAREVIGHYHELLRSTAQRHRAGVTKYIGDGFMAVWGVPEIGPDDAAHAVAGAVELQERFVDLAARVGQTHGVELALRVAVNTGEVVVGAGDADLVGDALNVGARLEAECPRGHVVVGEETWRSTRGRYSYESLGQVQVKGRTAPVAVYQWLGRQSEAEDAAPFVGRAAEVRRLQAVLDDAVSARAARLATVIGDPGVGKSRLAAEFTGAQSDYRVIQARCDVEASVALAPIVEVLRARDLETDVPASTPERDRLLRDLNGLVTGVAGSVEENFWALRRFVEVLASGGPVVLVLDDIQWADTLLLDFIEHLVEWVQEVPVLVLALARPELRQIRPDLATVGRWVSEAIHLGGLDSRATAELAAKVLGTKQLPDDLVRRLPSSTGGNPLFVRELIGMLAHDGVLVSEPTGWRLTIDVDAITIPPTIHALLASRLERLDTTDRRVLEIASVIGSEFSLGAVRALAGKGAAGVKSSLDRLRRLELAQPSGTYVGDEPLWRFHHVLIRDVAYRRLLKSDRADLHERLADWVEAGGQGLAFDSDELAARHMEAAHNYRVELGKLDERTGDLALRSARHYAASARRALDRDELVSAGIQAARGAALASADNAAHADLLLIGCEAFLSAGDVASSAPLVDDLERIAGEGLAPWATCYRCQFVVYTEPERIPEVDARLQDAIDEFSRRNDPSGLAKAHRVRAGARARLGRVGDCEVDLFEALMAARKSGDHRQITAALGAAPSAALWGPSSVPKAGGRCLDVVRMQRMTTAAPSLEATSLRCLAVLELLRGRPAKARTMLADARKIVADLGLRHGLMETELFAGIIESMEGDPVAAEPHFRTALEGFAALGVDADAGQAAALLARSVLAQGRLAEADRYAAESERLAGRNLKAAIAWRAVRGEIMAAQGRHDEAAAIARDAVAVAAATDLMLDHADACLALSRVLASSGDAIGARGARDDADALYAAKEVANAIGRAQPVVPAVSVPVATPDPTSSRLTVTNESCESLGPFVSSMRAHDVNGTLAAFSDRFVYDDHRHLSGDPIIGLDAMRAAIERIFEQFTHFEFRVLAVRGQRLNLLWNRWSDDDGNETITLYVNETGDDGRAVYQGRFDEDDFEGAYRELERRYYAGEGAAFAGCGAVGTEWTMALNRGDLDLLFDQLTAHDFHLENRSRSAFSDRSTAEFRAAIEELNAMVASARGWYSAVCWASPNWAVVRTEREGIGHDGERYTWSWIYVGEFRDGRLASVCQFEVDDEAAAFAYAEERVRATTTRLTVTNRACDVMDDSWRATQSQDVDGAVAVYADGLIYDDQRRLSGDPVRGAAAFRAGVTRVLEHYPHSDWRTLAVRGDRLTMRSLRMWDDAGNESTGLHVVEIGNDGLVAYHGRFDEDDFEGAYRELERRYYIGEGAAFAEAGTTTTDYVIALNQGDLDRVFDELGAPDLRIENRSRSAFPDRSAAEYRATLADLSAMVASARSWYSAMSWLSQTCCVARAEREATGDDAEQYTWTKLFVTEVRDGRVAVVCEFDSDAEDAAFAYAEERVRASASRLAVANRASRVGHRVVRAVDMRDSETAIAGYADQFTYDDRRRLSGDQVENAAGMRAAFERIREQYSKYEARTLAVRGDRLSLARSCWSDDEGNESAHFQLIELGDGDGITYHGVFDEEDFEGAYRELERRYYAAEGAAFAEAGAAGAEYLLAINRSDYDRVFGELSSPHLHVENRSRAPFPDPSVTPLASFVDLDEVIVSARTWASSVRWLSAVSAVVRLEREALGRDGEQYSWTWLDVAEIRDGRLASTCFFELDAEDAAFAYAEERMRSTASRLGVRNRSSELVYAFGTALQAADIDATMAYFTEQYAYDDRRRLSGDPVHGSAQLRAAFDRIRKQYSRFESRTLAVRGDRMSLHWSRWADDAENETAYLHVFEVGDDDRMNCEVRFDEDDFEGAYRELEKRYYAGEGAAFAEAGTTQTEWIAAVGRGDFDRAFDELTVPDLRVENRSRSAFPDRTASEFRASLEELAAMVASMRTWNSAMCWLSPTCSVVRAEREAIGKDGEQYLWSWLIVVEVRGGRNASMCLFDVDDEDAAFAYAEERMRTAISRLALTNLASQRGEALVTAMQAHDVGGSVACFAEDFAYDEDTVEQILLQYKHFEIHTLAVRGERLHLNRGRWTNDAGYESVHLAINEVDRNGLISVQVRFDEDDFEGAYRELERRYYAAEGAAFAESGAVSTEWPLALNRCDFHRVFGELTATDMRVTNRSRSAFPDRSAIEYRTTLEELAAMVTSARSWNAAVRWLSPNCCVVRSERDAVGQDGDEYTWSWLIAVEVRGGRIASMCQFESDDEEAAFAYADERVRASISRLALTNRAAETWNDLARAARAREVDDMVGCYAEQIVYDDRRRLGGNPLDDLRDGAVQILSQYNQFEFRTQAVRGDRVHLGWTRWSNQDGYETTYLIVHEVGENDRIVYEGRFDGDDFEGAYREIERRYYAGEGAAFAESGPVSTEWVLASNRAAYDGAFGELSRPDLRIENRSRSGFPDRSAAEFRTGLEELDAMFASVRTWSSAIRWPSPTCCVCRVEREAAGRDGEQYEWTRILVVEYVAGRVASICEFELDDEAAAFAYAEEVVRPATRLPRTNRARETSSAILSAARAHDVDAMAGFYSEPFVYDDRRRLGGNPVVDLRAAQAKILAQYDQFEDRTLAVRGERLHLGWTRWSNESGYETTYLVVHEVGDDGHIEYEGRFDGDDFEGAYREIERRYYAGEGAAFAESGLAELEWITALNQGDLARLFDELTDRGMRFEIRSRSAFPNRSAAELRASLEELDTWVASTRSWHSATCWVSPTCCVSRTEREAVGHDGERYAWSQLYVAEVRDGRGAASCEFDVDAEAAAFAYAEEQARAEVTE